MTSRRAFHDGMSAGFTLRLFRYRVPLADPLRLARGGPVIDREGVIVRLTDGSGRAGWGDAAPLPGFSQESVEEVIQALQQVEVLRLPDPSAPPPGTVPSLPPSAQFGLELASWNLRAQREGRPLHLLLNPEAARYVPLNALLASDRAGLVRRAHHLFDQGYRVFKLKVGRAEVVEDAQLVRTLLAHLGPTALLRLDPNRAWTRDQALSFLEMTGLDQVDYLEEPLADPRELPALVAATGCPIALDETLLDLEPDDLAAHAYAKAIVLKPTLLGGARALAFARAAQALSVQTTWSASFESGIGLRGLLALAAATAPNVAAGLDTYRWLAADTLSQRLPLQHTPVPVSEALEEAVVPNFKVMTPIPTPRPAPKLSV